MARASLLVLFCVACGSSSTTETPPPPPAAPPPSKISPVATAVWNGQPVTIEFDGANALTGDGVVIVFDAAATAVAANGSDGITVNGGDKIAVACKPACQTLKLTIPAAWHSVDITARSTNGGIAFTGEVPTVRALDMKCTGTGDITVKAKVKKGARIVLASEFDTTISLPEDFSADEVTVVGSSVDSTDFPGMKGDGSPFGKRGVGAASLDVTAGGDMGRARIEKIL